MPKEKKPLYRTPAGESLWLWVHEYDEREIKGNPQKPAYKANVVYDAKSPNWLALKEKIDALVDEAYDKAVEENPKKKKKITKAYPYDMLTDEDGEETGKVKLKLKQNASYKEKKSGKTKWVVVPVFDAHGKIMKAYCAHLDEDGEVVFGKRAVFNGSTIKASFATRPYLMESTDKAGVSLDLKAIQVLSLVSGGERSASSYGFEDEDGYSVDEEDVEESASSTTAEEDEGEAAEDDAKDPTDF